MQNRQFSIRGRSGYIPGFRGGRRGHGLRGGGGTISRGTDRYVQRFGGVFRGRSSNSHMRNESNKNEDNTGYTGYSDYNNDNTKNERPIRGGFRAFGRYRSKFDPVNR